MPSQSNDRLVVYVVEKGCYADRWLAGIYTTAEKAMIHEEDVK